MKHPVRFTLARYARFFVRQEAEIIEFGPDKIILLRASEPLKSIPYDSISEITYTDFNKSVPQWLMAMGGNAITRREARFEVEHKSGFHRLALELDAEYRKAEMRELFRFLYLKGITFRERTYLGGSLFLLDHTEPDEIGNKIRALRTGDMRN